MGFRKTLGDCIELHEISKQFTRLHETSKLKSPLFSSRFTITCLDRCTDILGMRRNRVQTGIPGFGHSQVRLFPRSVVPGFGHSPVRLFPGSIIPGFGHSELSIYFTGIYGKFKE
jgi:hypothetical protein